jgi:MFS family permease
MLIFTGYLSLRVMLPYYLERSFVSAILALLIEPLVVVGGIGWGLFADFNVIPKRFLLAGCMSVAGAFICLMPHIGNFVGRFIACAVVGLFVGAFFTLLMVVLAEKFGEQRLHSTFGLVAMFMGSSFLYAAPLAGEFFLARTISDEKQ